MKTKTTSSNGTQIVGHWQARADTVNQQVDVVLDASKPVLTAGAVLTMDVVGEFLKSDPRFIPYTPSIDAASVIVKPLIGEVINQSVDASIKPMAHESVNHSFQSMQKQASSIKIN
jgi:hypothetical protein